MECLEHYRKIIELLMQEFADDSSDETVETQLICDRDSDHYQVVTLGWHGQKRFYSVLLHLDIKDGKVWIQRNQTDRLVAQESVQLGVAREDIVLGLQPEFARSDTNYSVA